MRPQDIVVLLKKVALNRHDITNARIAKELGISPSEVSEALERCRIARLTDNLKQRVNVLALKEFMIHGLKYVFPVQPGAKVRGMVTAISAPPMNSKIVAGKDVYVWPDAKGNIRGETITPLYRTVPEAARADAVLYALLAIADVFRIGRAREVEIAKAELDIILSAYDTK